MLGDIGRRIALQYGCPSAPPDQKKRVTGGKPIHKRPGKGTYQPYSVPADRFRINQHRALKQ
jgi:hypothetical protein